MTEFFARLKQRKIVQWAIAYVAGAWAVLQLLDLVAQEFGWPGVVMRIITVVLAIGFFVALVLAWYHGERGAQRVGGIELVMLAALLVIAAVAVSWVRHEHRTAGSTVAAVSPVASAASAATRPGSARGRASAAASSVVVAPIAAQPIPAKSIAVLPFENLNVGKQDAYFVAGMQDLILTKLADIGDLKVISRTSTLQYGSHPENLKRIGQQLGVATILEGSVQKSGNQVLVNVQLIDARTDSHIWAHSYIRTLKNVFGVEGDVAGKVATALNAKLSPTATTQLATSLSDNQEANDLFLRADYEVNKGLINVDRARWKAAIPLYRQAIAKAPKFALAWARLSHTESTLARFGGGGMDVTQLFADARKHAELALQLAPGLPAAHLAIGYNDYYGRDDFTGALKAFSAALALRPNDANALTAKGLVDRRLGRFNDALASLQQAFALDPHDSFVAAYAADACMLLGRYPDAERWLRVATALDPQNFTAATDLPRVIVLATGDIPRALAEVQGGEPTLKLGRVRLLTLQRKYREALALLGTVPDTPANFADRQGAKSLLQADLYRLMGDMAHARPLYTQALPRIRARLKQQEGIKQAFVWVNVARAELGLGHTRQALATIAKVHAINVRSHDHAFGPGFMQVNAALYAEARRPDLAVPLLAKALATPGVGDSYSPVMLWLDPVWDPIRKDPSFQALLKQYAKYKPAVVYPAPPPSSTASPTSTAANGVGHD